MFLQSGRDQEGAILSVNGAGLPHFGHDKPGRSAYARFRMSMLRALLLRHRALALLVLAATLCLKAIVPAGYMVDTGARAITVRLCNDASGPAAPQAITIPMKPDAAPHPGDPDGSKATPGCAYGALNLALLGGADPVLLALALAFIVLLGFVPSPRPGASRPAYLRPPLRAPPALV